MADGTRAAQALRPAEHDRVFVLLGATSALGPGYPLLEWGGNVAAIARPGKKLEDLMQYARATAGGGTLLGPSIAGKAGLDLLAQLPEAVEWLLQLSQGWATVHSGREVELCLGSYIYLDGEAHVRASAAMDAVVAALGQAGVRHSVAYLGTPSSTHLWPVAAEDAAKGRWEKSLGTLQLEVLRATAIQSASMQRCRRGRRRVGSRTISWCSRVPIMPSPRRPSSGVV